MNLSSFYKRNRLAIVTWAYWFLLAYAIAALVWWFVELLQQNQETYLFKKELLSLSDPAYAVKLLSLEKEREMNISQYIGEGVTFMALILAGAVYVYRSVRRQIRMNEQQQNFMMAVTHELKTPIAITKLNLETLQKRKLDAVQQEKILRITLMENGRLNDLCDNILLAAQIDAGRLLLNPEKTDLSAILEQTVAYQRNRFPKRDIQGEIQDGIHVNGDPLLLHLLANNLMENALKYSPADKPVKVTLERNVGGTLLCVYDRGTGIPEQEKKRIFQKFYRVGNENTRRTKGTGLGLYLSSKIAEDHGAVISIADNQPSGSIFMVEFRTYQDGK